MHMILTDPAKNGRFSDLGAMIVDAQMKQAKYIQMSKKAKTTAKLDAQSGPYVPPVTCQSKLCLRISF